MERLGGAVVGASRTRWRGDPRTGFREGSRLNSAEGQQACRVS